MASNMIFISYSRQDKEFVNQLTKDLKGAGFNLWVDTESLEPGTASWERAIREAIKDSAAIVLVASPDALQSDYVQGELTVAKLLNRPIYPIWANGENWIDCVPLDMANYQYVDGRYNNYSDGIEKLVRILPGRASVSFDDNLSIIINIPKQSSIKLMFNNYLNVKNLLNDLYLKHLKLMFPAYSYGSDWVLVNAKTQQICVPWLWLYEENRGRSLHFVAQNWKLATLLQYDIKPQTTWNIVAPSKLTLFPIGVATNKSTLIDNLENDNFLNHLQQAFQKGHLSSSNPRDIIPLYYRKVFVINMDRNINSLWEQFSALADSF